MTLYFCILILCTVESTCCCMGPPSCVTSPCVLCLQVVPSSPVSCSSGTPSPGCPPNFTPHHLPIQASIPPALPNCPPVSICIMDCIVYRCVYRLCIVVLCVMYITFVLYTCILWDICIVYDISNSCICFTGTDIRNN